MRRPVTVDDCALSPHVLANAVEVPSADLPPYLLSAPHPATIQLPGPGLATPACDPPGLGTGTRLGATYRAELSSLTYSLRVGHVPCILLRWPAILVLW